MIDPTVLAGFLLQGAIFTLLVVAIRHRNVAAVINAFAAFVLALLPTLLGVVVHGILGQGVSFAPTLVLWLATAGFVHSLGMLGVYESTWWWDHLTHTVSAALLAALIYAGVIATFPETVGSGRSATTIAAVLGFTFAIGIFWELIELVAREVGERYDIEPVLVHYGWDDTAADLVFDVVGALLVLGVDLRVFVPLVEQFPDVTRDILLASGWVVFGGSVVMAVFIGLTAYMRSATDV
jgi:hypothetical protein